MAHYNDWASWRLKSPATRLFVQQPVQQKQRKQQSSSLLAMLGESADSHFKGLVIRETFLCHDVIVQLLNETESHIMFFDYNNIYHFFSNSTDNR